MMLKNFISVYIFFLILPLKAVHISGENIVGVDSNNSHLVKIIVDFHSKDGVKEEDIEGKTVLERIKEVISDDKNRPHLSKLVFQNILSWEDFECTGYSISNLITNKNIPPTIKISCLTHENAEKGIIENIKYILLPAIEDDLNDMAQKAVKRRKGNPVLEN